MSLIGAGGGELTGNINNLKKMGGQNLQKGWQEKSNPEQSNQNQKIKCKKRIYIFGRNAYCSETFLFFFREGPFLHSLGLWAIDCRYLSLLFYINILGIPRKIYERKNCMQEHTALLKILLISNFLKIIIILMFSCLYLYSTKYW